MANNKFIRGGDGVTFERNLTSSAPAPLPLTNDTQAFVRQSRIFGFTLAEVFTPHFTGYRKAAFTLAEVLITLGIIGVVAAMTLPSVINNIQNRQLETALKKSYSNLAVVMQRMIVEDYGGQVPVNDINEFKKLVSTFNKYYVNTKQCSGNDTKNGCPVMGGTAYDFMRENYKTFNGHTPGAIGNDALTNTVDGSTIFIDYATPVEEISGKFMIAVDVNGWNKRPNRWGHDIFMFQLNSNGKFLPMGVEGSQWPAETFCTASSTSTYNGYGCTAKALNEPDYFKNLPK